MLTIRSFFLILTHLQTPPDAIILTFPNILSNLFFYNDMFFSGHTAMIFLGFFLSDNKKIKYVFLFGSIIMGITSLLVHHHYSIDVFAAFFITYGSYKIGNFLLNKSNLFLRVN